MSHSLAFAFRLVLDNSALWDVLRELPFGMLTFLFDFSPVGIAPSSGLMKLLVAPESSTALCPKISLNDLTGM